MADVSRVDLLSKPELLALAEELNLQEGSDSPLTQANKKGELVEAFSPLLTDEQVDAALEAAGKLPADDEPEEDNDEGDQPDPALEPGEGEAPKKKTGKLSVGDKVKYPHKESFGGVRVSRVLAVDDETVTVRGIDGGPKTLAKELVELA